KSKTEEASGQPSVPIRQPLSLWCLTLKKTVAELLQIEDFTERENLINSLVDETLKSYVRVLLAAKNDVNAALLLIKYDAQFSSLKPSVLINCGAEEEFINKLYGAVIQFKTITDALKDLIKSEIETKDRWPVMHKLAKILLATGADVDVIIDDEE